jgi:hypothetical protein
MQKEVPNSIGSAKTLFIAETDGIFDLVQRNLQEIEINFLAVCQYNSDEGYYLFGCDNDFNTHTDFYYDELEKALEDAKRIYDLEQINWKQWLPTMEFTDTVKINIPAFDGVSLRMPIKAKSLGNNQFLILNNNEFDCTDYSFLPKFIPGDIVLAPMEFDEGENKNIDLSLVKQSSHPDKKFFEFLYHATVGDLATDKTSLTKYKAEIHRVKDEYAKGRYFYPSILETIDKLDSIVLQ